MFCMHLLGNVLYPLFFPSGWNSNITSTARAAIIDHAIEACVRDGGMTKEKSGSLMTKDPHFLPGWLFVSLCGREKDISVIFKLQLFGNFYYSQLNIILTHLERQEPDHTGHHKDFVVTQREQWAVTKEGGMPCLVPSTSSKATLFLSLCIHSSPSVGWVYHFQVLP